MKKDKIKYVVGTDTPKALPLKPFSDVVCEFLDDLSKFLRKDITAQKYPDIISVAFWCRKANIIKIKRDFDDGKYNIGRGIVFHITPSNVPVNFLYSYIYGILSGNTNIVRVPNKEFAQIKIICDAINKVLEDHKYAIIKRTTLMISYEKDKEITDYYSSICDCRIIWGGNQAIRSIRQSPMKEKAFEIVFADRYSFALFNSDIINEMSDNDLQQLTNRFYNDTYLMDQNACSTPHLILWTGRNKMAAKRKFWENVVKTASKFDLAPIKVVDKYTQLCKLAIERDDIEKISKWGNILYTVEMSQLPDDISSLRGKFGLFYQYDCDDINQIAPKITDKVQTLVYCGMNKDELAKFVIQNHLQGIDRIVPIGEALNIGVHWDGYDIIKMLSRQIIL